MSRFQQIRVRIEPVYKKGLAKAFPNVQRVLSGVDNRLLEESPSLYDLVPVLVHLSQYTDLEPVVSRAVAAHGERIVQLRRQIDEKIGGWRLSEAETLLNDLEDAFQDLDKDLKEA